jgi:hypothetical protein
LNKALGKLNNNTMVDEKNGGVTPYNETEAYAEAGHYGATGVSPGFNSSYGSFTCKGIWNIYFQCLDRYDRKCTYQKVSLFIGQYFKIIMKRYFQVLIVTVA